MPAKKRKCIDCGALTTGLRCWPCNAAWRKNNAHSLQRSNRVFIEESKVAPSLPAVPRVYGEGVLLTDVHVPYHLPEALSKAIEVGQALGVKQLFVLGDLLDGNSLSTFEQRGHGVPITNEVISAGRVMATLRQHFERIYIIPGNHDQRAERSLARLERTPGGKAMLELLANALDVQDASPGEIALSFFEKFLVDEGTELYELPQMVLNDKWLLQHPGTARKNTTSLEKEIAETEHLCVVQGHSHSWGLGFDKSAKFVAWNMGHACMPEKFRYKREKPKPFPKPVPGIGVIYQTKDNRQGKLIPLALHEHMFDIIEVLQRAKKVEEG